MNALQRIATHFVAPPPRAVRAEPAAAPPASAPACTPASAPAAHARAASAAAPAIAILCPPADANVIGAALGLALARERRATCVLVCVWTGGAAARPAWRAPAMPGARRVVANLASHRLDARPAGRLALLRLPSDRDDAVSAALRASAAAGRAPTVLALGGPRACAFDALLEIQDLVVVATRAGTDARLPRLAVAGLAARRVPACACEVPAMAPARALASAGAVLLPSARRALAGPLEALS